MRVPASSEPRHARARVRSCGRGPARLRVAASTPVEKVWPAAPSSASGEAANHSGILDMKFVRAIWKLLVGIKDALVLIFMLLFFGMLYGALSARPAPVRDGVLDLSLKGSLVEQPARRDWTEVAGGGRLQEY